MEKKKTAFNKHKMTDMKKIQNNKEDVNLRSGDLNEVLIIYLLCGVFCWFVQQRDNFGGCCSLNEMGSAMFRG